MAKLKIVKPTGSEDNLNLISAFKADNNAFVILDSEKTGSMGLPIIYVSKLSDNRLEKINDDSEWENAKRYLKGIINGTNFEYIKIGEEINADEVYFKPLTLPQASFDLIKSRYVVKDTDATGASVPDMLTDIPNADVVAAAPTMTEQAPQVAPAVDISNQALVSEPPVTAPQETAQSPIISTNESVLETASPTINLTPANSIPQEPIIPNNNIQSNKEVSSIPIAPAANPQNDNIVSVGPSVVPTSPKTQNSQVSVQNADVQATPANVVTLDASISQNNNKEILNVFDNDKETFLKACENMFDALISKYQKQFAELDKREQVLKQKEQEIDEKLHSANEHLANAEAREAVANIAHDNAQKVMDLSSMMPKSPNETQAGVI